MATWKKVIVSGSIAELNIVSASGGFHGDGSDLTGITADSVANSLTDGTGIADFTFDGSGAVSIATDDSAIVHDDLSGFVANEHIDHSSVSITAGNGLTGGGTIASTRAINVGAGTGIDVSTDAISVDVSDFMSSGANNRILTATGADAFQGETALTFDGTTLDINTANSKLSFEGAVVVSGSHQLLHIGDTEEQSTGTQLQINDTTETFKMFAAGGTATSTTLNVLGHVSASSISASGNIHATKYFGDGSGLSNLTSAADGTLTLATSGAINGSATFTANQSGDTTFTVSVDDATTSAKGVASFSSDNFSVSSGAVSIKNGGVALAEMANLAADKIIGRANGAGTGVPTALSAAQVKTILSLTNVPDSDHTAAGYSTVTQLNASSSALQTNIDAKQDTLTFGISNTNAVKIDSTSVADDEYARFTANGLESRSTSEVLSDIGAQAALTFGISNTNVLRANANVANDDFLRVDGTSIEGRSAAQVVSDLGIEAGATADQTAGDIGTLFAASTAAVTFGGAVTVEGDLTVNGDLTTVNTTNLLVEDKFTTFASGSTSSTDGGIIVQGAASAGQGYGWDSATGRWAFDDDMALSATGLSPDGYVAIVSGSAQDAAGNPNYGGSSNGYGNIHINTSTGDIFIYV